MSNMVTAQAHEQMIIQLRSLQRELNALKAGKQAHPGGAHYQKIVQGKVVDVNVDNTVNVRVLAGLTRLETNWIIYSAIPASADVVPAVDSFVTLAINGQAPHFVLSGSGSGADGSQLFSVGWPANAT